jgi:hypothetical protein
MNNPATSCHSRQAIRPTCSATRISDAPMSAGSENIPPLQGSERSARLCQSFRPDALGSTSAALAAKRYFSRIVFGADRIGVCATALPNFPEKNHSKTRGFTSCFASFILPPMNLQASPAFSFQRWRPAGLAGIAEHVRHGAFKPLQQKFQGFQCDILFAHFHPMKR